METYKIKKYLDEHNYDYTETVKNTINTETEVIKIKIYDEDGMPNGNIEIYPSKINDTEDIDRIIEYRMEHTDITKNKPDRVITGVINTEWNKEILKDIPHEEIADLSIIKIGTYDKEKYDSPDGMAISLPGTTPKNIKLLDTIEVHDEFVMGGISDFPTIDDLKKTIPLNENTPINIIKNLYENSVNVYVTNKQRYYGAGVITYDKIMKHLYNAIGEFTFAPSSIHEIILIPNDLTEDHYDEFNQMVKDINKKEVAVKDRLADHIYKYDGKEIISIIT